MYIPKYNKVTEQETIFRYLRENGFAILVSESNGEIIATHVPVEIEAGDDGSHVIRTHLAKANLQWKHFTDGKEVLLIFSGPHTYISSSWYDHVNVPTWNYIAVHVYGKVKILDDAAATAMLSRLVNRYEQASENPFHISQLDAAFMRSHLKALVAIEISMDRIDTKEKLSQNRDAHNYQLILDALDKRTDEQSHDIKREMERVQKTLFNKL